jgi:drug/metabolite transporter (DMT)-like permease
MLHEHGNELDGGTAAFQRVLGGLLIGGLSLLAVKWRAIKQHFSFSNGPGALPSREKWRRVWPWVLANSLAGQTIGVSCYLWALQTTPTGIVLPIVATTPLVAIPFALAIEKEHPSRHSIIGGVIAVGGVIALSFYK